MHHRHRVWLLAVISLGVLLLSGCVSESRNGDRVTYTNQLWVPLVVLLGGIVSGVGGWFLREWLGRYAWALIVLGPVAAIFFAPSLFMDRATVDKERLTTRTGIWGLTAVHEVPFEQLAGVHLTLETRRGRRGRQVKSYYLVCDMRGGGSEKIPLGNSVVEAAVPLFLQEAKARGVSIVDETANQ